jgi:hypothetical protein
MAAVFGVEWGDRLEWIAAGEPGSSRFGLWRGPSPRLQATSRLRPFADPCLRLAAALTMSKGVSATFPVSFLSTSSHRQRGLPSGKPGAEVGSVPSATHLSQVSGEILSSDAPVSRSTKAGGRSPRGTRLRLRVVTPPPPGPHRARRLTGSGSPPLYVARGGRQGRDRHGRHDSSVARRASQRARLSVHRTRISATLWVRPRRKPRFALSISHNAVEPWSSCCIATNGVCYSNMEGLNYLRSASGKAWIGIGRPPVSWRAARVRISPSAPSNTMR